MVSLGKPIPNKIHNPGRMAERKLAMGILRIGGTGTDGHRARASPGVWRRLGVFRGLTLHVGHAESGSEPLALPVPVRPDFPIAGFLRRERGRR